MTPKYEPKYQTATGVASITPAGLSATADAASRMSNRLNFGGMPTGTPGAGGSYVITPGGLYSGIYNITYNTNVLTILSSPTPITLTGGVYETWYGILRSKAPRLLVGM